MVPRRNVPPRRKPPVGTRPGADRPTAFSATEREEQWREQPYRVRSVSGSASGTGYRCPGCDQLLAAQIGHVVAWPADDIEAEDRRHWHTACWAARDSRRPGVQRSRNAPRYS